MGDRKSFNNNSQSGVLMRSGNSFERSRFVTNAHAVLQKSPHIAQVTEAIALVSAFIESQPIITW
ncbi:hypothetical protein [Nostoc sp. NMS4]|uniref:hypothetical protein n=1 Tax=Nostoc sp. NMS4 TaxID=2815390 RepID=UPI0025D23188|nr:hypothetical protein [Nostoc sp. NMS4]MBN3924132.1 hypothetical protein [Nostoc sp. NMS4]